MKAKLLIAATLMLAVGSGALFSAWKIYQARQQRSGSTTVPESTLPPDASAPILTSFTLTDQSGSPFGSDDLKGSVWIANFFFATCPGSCTRQSQLVNELREEFGDAGVKFVSITVDPTVDTPDKLEAYSRKFVAKPGQWYFLSGDMTYIRRVGAEYFELLVQEKTHQDRLVLVDATGEIVGAYNWHDAASLSLLKKKLKKLAQADAT